MARTKALGGWLKQSKGKEKERKVLASAKKRENLGAELAVWKARGCLWTITLLLAVVGNSTGNQNELYALTAWLTEIPISAAFGYSLPHQMARLRPILPATTMVSILWTVWDPTYSAFRRAQIQGRDVRVQGKRLYIVRGCIINSE